ncbi:hypothetical protein PPERSA_11660 [Pseudocohnilembus persalinus]|uniref:Uncharacterized protein n=1 Tax=Pseudocohnilembus persalinus TaxID=266149 RepID=A0A0V0QA05_PSEPJ|nr:hypothetical protein PPERSA_11660 [Pseudocohnilembus persalinus]|eukprot:KRW99059.1 hypothetical protein PPERSA_11660 [Pseudocohnilembus persalinus]
MNLKIYNQLQSRNSEIDKDLYNPRDQMFAIETQMNNLFRTKNELYDQAMYKGAEQQVKQEENKANKQAQKIQEKQRIEEKALEREKKRERAIQEKRTGRAIVKKVILQKKEKQVEQVQEDNDDKYLDENYYI